MVQGRPAIPEMLAECCSRMGYQADHRSCALVDASPLVVAGRVAPQVQLHHVRRGRPVVSAHQVGLGQVPPQQQGH